MDGGAVRRTRGRCAKGVGGAFVGRERRRTSSITVRLRSTRVTMMVSGVGDGWCWLASVWFVQLDVGGREGMGRREERGERMS